MLYLVGAGLVPRHISVEGVSILKSADRIILDTYTVPAPEEFVKELEEIVEKEFERGERPDLEEGATELVEEAKNKNIVILSFGDPLAATTHVVLTLIADERGVPWKYVPGISILTYAASRVGLEHYKFGWTVTIPHQWKTSPSFYERIRENCKKRMHTLVLLDVGEDPMTIPDAIDALLYWAEREGRNWGKIVGIARAAYDDEFIAYGDPEVLQEIEWGPPPHAIIVPSKLHPVEEDALRRFTVGER